MVVTWWILAAFLAAQVVTLVVALSALRGAQNRFWSSTLAKRMIALESEMSELLGAWEKTQSWAKRVNQRLYQQQKREEQKPNGKENTLPDPARDPQGWRDAVARKYALRENVPGGDE